DIEIAVVKSLDVGGEGDGTGGGEFLVGDLTGAVAAASKFADPGLVDVETHHRKVPRHIDGKRQPDIAKANDPDPPVLDRGRPRLPGSLTRCRLNLVIHGQVLSSLDIGAWLSISRLFSQSSGKGRVGRPNLSSNR